VVGRYRIGLVEYGCVKKEKKRFGNNSMGISREGSQGQN